MQLAFTEEQEELRRTAREFLAEHAASERVRAAMASELGWDLEAWRAIGGDLGWTGVAIPEAYGGVGLGFIELAALCEPMGEALLCAPFFSTLGLAVPALLAAGDSAAARAWLPAIAEGRATAALVAEGVTAVRRDAGYALEGGARLVLDGHAADLLVVAAAHADGTSLFAVPAGAAGVTRRAHATMDQTRRFAAVELRGVAVGADALVGEAGQGGAALDAALEAGRVALAAEQVGGAQRCLDLSVAYAKERVQFGRAIGSFQAIKHKCADMMAAVESARSATYYAACAVAEDDAGVPALTSTAKAWASEAYFRCAADALQIHGGVGFTWEYDVHLHLKRARSMESFLGTPAWHRERVAASVLG